MSLQEDRDKIIRENIPKLIGAITGLKAGDKEYNERVDNAFSVLQNYRGLSTNSHEVRRKIEGIQEKLRVDNCSDYAEYFRDLCNACINHPYFNNCDTDVCWSILQLLLEIANKPSVFIRRNKDKLPIKPIVDVNEDCTSDHELDALKKELKNDNISLEYLKDESSDLSDWSDNESSEISPNSYPLIQYPSSVELEVVWQPVQHLLMGVLEPPERQHSWRMFETNTDASLQILRERIQNKWWLKNMGYGEAEIKSRYLEANFAVIYARYLDDISKNYVIIQEPSIVSENNLIREIIWCFCFKKSSKFFNIKKGSIVVHENVSIPSISVNCLAYALEYQIIPYMRMFHSLMNTIDLIEAGEQILPTNTLQCYSYNLQMLLQPIKKVFMEWERKATDSGNADSPMTFISTILQFREAFHSIGILYEINKSVVIESNKCPAHISSAYLLTSLLDYNKQTFGAQRTNVSIALFLTSIRAFFNIMDMWWTEGHFRDWKEEFVIEYCEGVGYCAREYEKNKEKSIFVPQKYSKVITSNKIIKLLLQYSLEAGIALHLLHQVNRMNELRNAFADIKKKMYNEFIETVMQKICNFEKEKLVSCDFVDSAIVGDTETNKNLQLNAPTEDSEYIMPNAPTACDEFLTFAFSVDTKANSHKCKEYNDVDEVDSYCNESGINSILKILNAGSAFLPLQQIIYDSLNTILHTRIGIANSFVIQLYKEEFMLLKHLSNIRNVFLLEANDMMYEFYKNLFAQIESLESWANPFLLTSQLEDLIANKQPSMVSLFSFDIRSQAACKKDKVYEVVDELILSYNRNREIAYVIDDEDIAVYNKVFCILLKVKWGITTLENLKFPRSQRKRDPYTALTMMDIIMRRLEQLRFWMIYSMHSIHFHLMTQVLQSMGKQLADNIMRCKNLREMKELHKCYLETVVNHCFLKDYDNPLRLGLDQMLQLIFIVRIEWNDCLQRLDDGHPLSLDVTDDTFSENNYHLATNSQMDTIESTYIRCHQYMANKLNTEVFINRRNFLSGLSAAFNTSVPY